MLFISSRPQCVDYDHYVFVSSWGVLPSLQILPLCWRLRLSVRDRSLRRTYWLSEWRGWRRSQMWWVRGQGWTITSHGILWDVISYRYPRYLLLAQNFSYMYTVFTQWSRHNTNVIMMPKRRCDIILTSYPVTALLLHHVPIGQCICGLVVPYGIKDLSQHWFR